MINFAALITCGGSCNKGSTQEKDENNKKNKR